MKALKFVLMIFIIISIAVGSVIYAVSAILRSISFLFWFDIPSAKKEIINFIKKNKQRINYNE